MLRALHAATEQLTSKQGSNIAQCTWQWLLTGAPFALLLTPYCHICAMDVLQGILHSCANAVKQKRLPARSLSHTACTISACSPPAVSACPALNVGCQELQAQCVPQGQPVESQVQRLAHLGHALIDSLTACKVIVMLFKVYLRHLIHSAYDHLYLICWLEVATMGVQSCLPVTESGTVACSEAWRVTVHMACRLSRQKKPVKNSQSHMQHVSSSLVSSLRALSTSWIHVNHVVQHRLLSAVCQNGAERCKVVNLG